MPGRYHRPTTAEERTRADQARTAKLEALLERLAEQVAALRTGQDWQRWLATAARFHDYSFGNTLLILAQRPDASAVAGYEAWKALGRQVDKGEKGIAILAPVVRRAASDPGDGQNDDPGDSPSHDPAAADRSDPQTPEQTPATSTRRITGFRVTYVWDVAQTSGKPLPRVPEPQLLQGQAPDGLWDALTGAVTTAGYTVERGPCDGANGVTTPATRTVRVRDDIDPAQAVKTLAHELGHVLLHAEQNADEPSEPLPCRGIVEIEAESLAYLISAVHGLDTGTYTFPYVTHWAEDVAGQTAEDVVRTTGERVLGAARKVLAIAAHPEPATTAARDAALGALADRTATARTATAALRARAQHTPQPQTPAPTGPERRPARAASKAQTGRARPEPARGGPTRSVDDVTRVELLEAHRLAHAFYREHATTAGSPTTSPAAP